MFQILCQFMQKVVCVNLLGIVFFGEKNNLVLSRPNLDIIRAEYFNKFKELFLFCLDYDNTLLSTFLNIFLSDQ